MRSTCHLRSWIGHRCSWIASAVDVKVEAPSLALGLTSIQFGVGGGPCLGALDFGAAECLAACDAFFVRKNEESKIFFRGVYSQETDEMSVAILDVMPKGIGVVLRVISRGAVTSQAER